MEVIGTTTLGLVARVALGGALRLPSERWSSLSDALRRHGLAGLSRLNACALAGECGLTDAQAARLSDAFVLGRETERGAQCERPFLRRPADVARFLAPGLRGLEVETFQVLVLDARHRLREHVEVSRGLLDAAPVHPREVFAPALRIAGAAVIVAHNHPSGDPEPSEADAAVTRRLTAAGRLVGIPLLDHVVIGGERWVSMRERGPWPVSADGSVDGSPDRPTDRPSDRPSDRPVPIGAPAGHVSRIARERGPGS